MCGGDIFGSIARLALASASFGTSELFEVGNMFSNKPNMEGKTVVSPQQQSSAKQSEADEAAVQAREESKKKAANMLGRRSTILTGSSGLTDRANTTKKTLLGA